MRSPAGPPFSPGSPLPFSLMRVPSLTPGLIFTVYVLMRRSRPVPWHFGHGCSMTVPLPRQRGHGCDSAKSPWLSVFTPRPLHSGQMTGAVPGRAPVPAHSRQAAIISTGTFASAPRSESSNERCTSASTSRPRIGWRAVRVRARVAAAAEHPAEDVADVAEVEVAEVDVRAAGRAGPPVLRAEAVVLLALLRIGEHVVRALHLLEALLRLLVARVRVRMMLAREPAVRLLDLVVGGALLHAERVVRVRHSATITRAGRTTRSPSL